MPTAALRRHPSREEPNRFASLVLGAVLRSETSSFRSIRARYRLIKLSLHPCSSGRVITLSRGREALRRRRIWQRTGLRHSLLLPGCIRTCLGVGGIEVVAVARRHSWLKIRGISSALPMHSHCLPFSIDIGLRPCHGGVCTVAAGGYGSRCLRHNASSTLGGGRVGDVETGLLFTLFINNPAVGEEQFWLLGAIPSLLRGENPFACWATGT